MLARRITHALLATLALSLAAPFAPAQMTGVCAGHANCAEVPSFVAAVTDFRTSQVDPGTRIVTATVRYLNKTNHPLSLGYVQGSGIVTDDQGNRYTVDGDAAVRGIGTISGTTFDPKFTLQPGEASDARFEFMLRLSSHNQILGTTYQIELTTREIDPVAGNQYRLGREYALRFRGAKGGTVAAGMPATPPTSPAAAAPPPMPAAALPQETDPCAGRARCYAAGPFVAEVTQFTQSRVGPFNDNVLRINVKIRNLTAQPLILAYKARSNSVTDNLGNRYYWGHAGSYDKSASGIGIVEGATADPQFVLDPGQSRTATFEVIRYRPGNAEIGTTFGYDLALMQLEILPSQQVRVGREYSVSFTNLSSGTGDAASAVVNDAGKKVFDALRKKLQKPR